MLLHYNMQFNTIGHPFIEHVTLLVIVLITVFISGALIVRRNVCRCVFSHLEALKYHL